MSIRRRITPVSSRHRLRQARRRLRRHDVSRFASWQREQGLDIGPLVRLVRLLTR